MGGLKVKETERENLESEVYIHAETTICMIICICAFVLHMYVCFIRAVYYTFLSEKIPAFHPSKPFVGAEVQQVFEAS